MGYEREQADIMLKTGANEAGAGSGAEVSEQGGRLKEAEVFGSVSSLSSLQLSGTATRAEAVVEETMSALEEMGQFKDGGSLKAGGI